MAVSRVEARIYGSEAIIMPSMLSSILRRTSKLLLATGLVIASVSRPALANGVELIMFNAPWCAPCRRFISEVLPIYSRSPLGQRIPIGIIDQSNQGRVRFILREQVQNTPTFILLDGDREVSRFVGYS